VTGTGLREAANKWGRHPRGRRPRELHLGHRLQPYGQANILTVSNTRPATRPPRSGPPAEPIAADAPWRFLRQPYRCAFGGSPNIKSRRSRTGIVQASVRHAEPEPWTQTPIAAARSLRSGPRGHPPSRRDPGQLPLAETIAADEPWRFLRQPVCTRRSWPGGRHRLSQNPGHKHPSRHSDAAIRTMRPPAEPIVTGTGRREDGGARNVSPAYQRATELSGGTTVCQAPSVGTAEEDHTGDPDLTVCPGACRLIWVKDHTCSSIFFSPEPGRTMRGGH
jgi:hypothetical protein